MATKTINGYKIYLENLLGKGSFGRVYSAKSTTTGESVAIKVLDKLDVDSNQYTRKAFFSEIKIMKSVKSQNIVELIDVLESSNNYYIVQELCDGDFSTVLKQGVLDEKLAKKYLLEIVNGFLVLVKEGIIHRDLKPANIMIKNNVLKIGDFGIAKKGGASIHDHTAIGSPQYMSPQALKAESYSSKNDIWALGTIYYEMLHGETPWSGFTQHHLIKNIETKPLQVDLHISKQSTGFISKCLALDEADRISWDELFLHPIFENYFQSKSISNREFQNKMKMEMSKLRYIIKSQNLDLLKIFNEKGYNQTAMLTKDNLFNFFKEIDQDLNTENFQEIFKKIDKKNEGQISRRYLEQILAKNSIDLKSIHHRMQEKSGEDLNSTDKALSKESQKKTQNCFIKLHKIIECQGKTLRDIFHQFDQEQKGFFNRSDFILMLNQLSSDVSGSEINAAFKMIDENNSDTIEYEELNRYYSSANNLELELESMSKAEGKYVTNPQKLMPKSQRKLQSEHSQDNSFLNINDLHLTKFPIFDIKKLQKNKKFNKSYAVPSGHEI